MTDHEITFIDTMYRDHMSLVLHLQNEQQISYSQVVHATLAKSLLLSIASYFESRITQAIKAYASHVTNNDEALTSLISNRFIERQYHSYFAWRKDGRSVNPFFGMFGTTFKDAAVGELKRDAVLTRAKNAFLEIGDDRNLLVHENFATYPLDKTPEEIYELYQSALVFVQFIEQKLRAASQASRGGK